MVHEPGTGKTETRRLLYSDRVVKKDGLPPASATYLQDHRPPIAEFGHYWALTGWHNRKPGDRLFVRENFSGPWSLRAEKPSEWRVRGMTPELWYWADGDPTDGDWTKPKPSIHLPRWGSRLTLIITDVWIERLQDITEGGAWQEGIDCIPRSLTRHGRLDGYGLAGITSPNDAHTTRVNAYRALWGSLHGSESWKLNPWIVAVRFKPILANVDSQEAKAA